MDSFEAVIGKLLEHEGFWVRQSVKVELSDADKKRINSPSSPRWELDLVAYRPKTNELWIVECKSYLDSGGVNISAFNGQNPKFGNRFKLFTQKGLYPVIEKSLIKQLVKVGACRKKPKVTLVLVAGKIAEKSKEHIEKHFNQKTNWKLWDVREIRKRLIKLSEESYDDTVVSVVSKILLRKGAE